MTNGDSAEVLFSKAMSEIEEILKTTLNDVGQIYSLYDETEEAEEKVCSTIAAIVTLKDSVKTQKAFVASYFKTKT